MVSHELVKGADGAFYIIEGDPTSGYDVFRCNITHEGHHRRKWQAREAVLPKGEWTGSSKRAGA